MDAYLGMFFCCIFDVYSQQLMFIEQIEDMGNDKNKNKAHTLYTYYTPRLTWGGSERVCKVCNECFYNTSQVGQISFNLIS
jgi:hypothetical protein